MYLCFLQPLYKLLYLTKMISLILVSIAAILNAAMDTLVQHFPVSVFKNLGSKWNPSEAWKLKYVDSDPSKGFKKINLFGFIPIIPPVAYWDYWHLFKSIMIVALCSAIVIYTPITPYKCLDIIILGTVWNLIFSFFYNHILVVKK